MKNVFYTCVGLLLSICLILIFIPFLLIYFIFNIFQKIKKINKNQKKNFLFGKDVVQ